MTEKSELVFLPLGGAGEIGMNLNLYGVGPEEDRKWLMVDLGVTFGDDRTPGIDLIMADTAFIEDYADDIVGLILTHAHEDHIGAVPHLWPLLECPVYATPFTAALVRAKLKDVGLVDEVPLHEVPLGGTVELDPFKVRFVTLTHSIPEPNALAIETPHGVIMHTGDWKIDADPLIGEQTDNTTLEAIGDEGVLAIVCDSTNVFEPGRAGSEGTVREGLAEVIAPLKGRVAVTAFASNVARVQTIAQVADQCGRHPVLVGRSMHRCVAAARACGYLKDMPPIIDEDEGAYLPPDKVLYICTGSQGEPRAALSRIARNDHPSVKMEPGDTVIFSSRIIPGNEVGIIALQNDLTALGVDIITDHHSPIHVSGHPCRDELAQMYQWIRPKIAVPVHGELRHLTEHAAFARDMQVAETHVALNGAMVRLAPGPSKIIDEVPAGRLYLDGEILIRSDDEGLRQRKRISYQGYIHVTVVLDANGKLKAEPLIVLEGLPPEDWDGRDLDYCVEEAIDAALAKLNPKDRKRDETVREKLRVAARRSVRDGAGKNPVTRVDVIRL